MSYLDHDYRIFHFFPLRFNCNSRNLITYKQVIDSTIERLLVIQNNSTVFYIQTIKVYFIR